MNHQPKIWTSCFIAAVLIGEISNKIIRSINDLSTSGSCTVDGVIYRSGQRVQRNNPCHFCICIESKVQCAWQDCPLPPENCSALEFEDICNPSLYICNIPEEVGIHYSNGRIGRRGADIDPEDDLQEPVDCSIMGVPYKTGDVIGAASHNCLECRCGKQDLYCSPRCCFRASSLSETPGSIMRALILGTKLPEKHPLHYLTSNYS